MHSRRSPGSSVTVAAPSPASRKETGARDGVPDASQSTLAWTSKPVRIDFPRFLVTLAVLLLVLAVALTGFHSILMAFIGALAVLGSVIEAFFPVRHRLSASGVSTRCAWQMRQMTWGSIRSARIGPDGIHLSPLSYGSRLSRIRGVTLRFDGGDRQGITDAVRSYLKRDPK